MARKKGGREGAFAPHSPPRGSLTAPARPDNHRHREIANASEVPILVTRTIPLTLPLSLPAADIRVNKSNLNSISFEPPEHPAHYLCLKDGWPAGQQGGGGGGAGGGLGVKTDLPKEEGNWPREAAAAAGDDDSSRGGGGGQQVEERGRGREREEVSICLHRHAARLPAPGNGLSVRPCQTMDIQLQ